MTRITIMLSLLLVCITIAEFHSITVPSSKIEKFLIFSAMSTDYIPKYTNYTKAKSAYSQQHGYDFLYKPEDFNFHPDIHPNLYRIHAALSLLQGTSMYTGPSADWIVYIDADAFFAEREIPLSVFLEAATEHYNKPLDRALDSKKSNTTASDDTNHQIAIIDTAPCQFLTQDYQHGVNSGFWLLRNSTWAVHFLQEWLAEHKKGEHYKLNWVFDQGPLQNLILHVSCRVCRVVVLFIWLRWWCEPRHLFHSFIRASSASN